MECFNIKMIDLWGLTEAVACVASQPLDGTGKPGSVGKALSGYKVKVVDDEGRELSSGEAGEVIIRGPMMKGYYNDVQATKKIIKDGWLYTGDLGAIDENGELSIVGRKKDMIISKGQNIYPSDIEDVLKMHPKVEEAAAVGVPDKMRGEVVRAVISLKKGKSLSERAIIKYCQKYLTNYKLPKQIIYMDCLPRDTSGEICKKELGKLPFVKATVRC